jgi:hypothetical protein
MGVFFSELGEPLGLEDDAAPLRGDDHVELLHVGVGVLQDLLVRHRRARLVLVRRVADLRRPVADDENDLVTPARKLAQLAHPYRVADVQVRSCGVKPLLDTQPTLARP